jgi:cyclin-dependent kinase-like
MQTQGNKRDKPSFIFDSPRPVLILYIVAIKKFKETDKEEVIRKTSIREVKILRMINHQNIVKLKEAFRRKEKLYLVFEFVDFSLLEVIEKNPGGLKVEGP